MGYLIELEEKAERVANLLRIRPGQLFPRPYAGYVLFLFGHTDTRQAEWFLESASFLDSLTGNSLAYAVFASTLELEAKPYNRDVRHLREAGYSAKSYTDSPAVSRLVREGGKVRLGQGRELIATTYGTDRIAGPLGVLDKLPCLVFLDALPGTEPYVVKLEPRMLPNLRDTFRAAVGEFLRDGNDARILSFSNRLAAIQDELQPLDSEESLRAREATAALQKRMKRANRNVLLSAKYVWDDAARVAMHAATLNEQHRELIDGSSQREQEIETQLAAVISEYRRASVKPFSSCFRDQVGASNMSSAVASTQSRLMNWVYGFFRPEVLTKVVEAAAKAGHP